MSDLSASPPAAVPQAVVDAIAAAGKKVITRTDTGSAMVWHVWGTGTPVVLLHGGHGSWTHWIRNVLPLSRHFQVWAADLPGFGDSDTYGSANDADGLWPPVASAIRQHIAPATGNAHVVAFSFGALVAGFLAANQPAVVRSLTLIGSAGFFGSDKPLEGMASLRNLTQPQEILAAHRQNMKVLMLHHDHAIDDLALHLQSINVPRDRMPGRRLAFSQVQQQLQAQWQCPVQGIWGRHDVLYQNGRLARLPEVLKDCDLRGIHVIDGAGHWVAYEAAEAVNAQIVQFIGGLEAPAGCLSSL